MIEKLASRVGNVNTRCTFFCYRKANEGLAAISDEEASPVSVRQMAYGKNLQL